MRLKPFSRYLLLCLPSLALAALVWSVGVTGRLYYCWDSAPLLDFIPPFVHEDPRDHYLAAPWIVYALWSVLLIAALWLPAFLAGAWRYCRTPRRGA